jgi:proteasome lid subunit RPN8/RPN11
MKETKDKATSNQPKRSPQATASQRFKRRVETPSPVLHFTPTAWAKLLFFCHYGDTEVGGFGVTRPNDLILVDEFLTVKQKTTLASVEFDDAAVADFFDAQVDAGRNPEQFARIWLHSHPGDCPGPSATDEETFQRVFGACTWAVMFILARSGETYARLRFNVGPHGGLLIPVRVDYAAPFAGSDHAAWEREYLTNVQPEPLTLGSFGGDLFADVYGDRDDVDGLSFPENVDDLDMDDERDLAVLLGDEDETWL